MPSLLAFSVRSGLMEKHTYINATVQTVVHTRRSHTVDLIAYRCRGSSHLTDDQSDPFGHRETYMKKLPLIVLGRSTNRPTRLLRWIAISTDD